ncbi:exodeoxyribonuclease VII large subunit [Alcanivorax sp. 521-1]|uniref:Exodeoxyribonuclease 7 large subunit n=2 Tax=Alloalcanivorax profundimaris TaxID=2735259 RepID=A0ABS0AWK3_9GAMM|nr:exodeoxyribonuclease VII large subunit [Alloalcanivorax profundimaris]
MRAMEPSSRSQPYSVSRLNLEAQGLLEGSFPLIWLQGELSNLARPRSGHIYFSLKDDRAQVSGAMFRNRNSRLRFQPRDGQQVLVRARITLYVPRGGFQIIVEHMEEAGEGALRAQFDALKAKMEAEGLFAQERKRPLPAWPRQIGVITSPSGAAIRDILHVLKRRAPSIPVLIFPTPVQGAEAPAQIRAALERATARGDCDVLVIGRGGGSLEDLWAFNDEALVRAVAASPVPVVSAVGHEVDVALTDFAADVRAPTPSAAAELISPDGETLLSRLSVLARRQRQFMGLALRGQRQRLEGLTRRLQARHPERQLEQTRQLVDEQQARLARALRQRLALLQSRWRPLDVRLRQQSPAQQVTRQAQRLAELRRRLPVPLTHQQRHLAQRLSGLGHRLNTASPLATLDRGYSLTLVEGEPLRSVEGLKEGQTVETRLAKGSFEATVTRVKPPE